MQDFLSRISHFSPKRLALLADELQRRVETLEAAQRAPIAIVGIGCRFPGGVDTPARYWALLTRGEDAITEVPVDRWDIAEYYDPDPDAPGKMSSRWGGFLKQVDRFDPHFFGISPREAQRMDPQQRLLLEVAWEALEHAGVNADRLAETRTGIFVGLSSIDYLQLMRDAGLESFDAYTASGAAHSIASGRLSYLLGTRGPSLSIDTACSSSLVAIHQAVSSLRRGESDLALAGGVNLILRPDVTIALSKAHMMAPDGRCKAFDSRADGFVRSEGCGILVLKRLADAQADGDAIVAVIRGSASNQDGRSNGLTAPNGSAQEAVLRAALDDARIEPRRVGFVEAHGTGTSLGDPIEVRALAAVLGTSRGADRPLLVGSVKASIGHLEAAAGVASVIKMALALQNGTVPAQLHFNEPNPFIPWDEIPVRVPREATAWPPIDDGTHIGGVSSFGFSGTNVHVVLSSAPQPAEADSTMERPRHVLTISARVEEAARTLAADYRRELQDDRASLADIAYTANAGRAALPHRIAVIASTREEAIARLDDVAAGRSAAAVLRGAVPARPPRVAFLFTGQGAQYAGMARSLYDTQPRFRQALDECERLLRPRLAQPLLTVLYPTDGNASPVDATEYTQPALFAVEYALAMLWRSWGVHPVAVLGHSIGEYAAACVAGVLGLDDGLMLVAERGRLMGALPRNGAMAAVMSDEAQITALIAPWRSEVAIAAVNGPKHVVISGRDSALDAILERATAAGVTFTRLTVSHAFHSPLVEPMLAEFERIAATVSYRPAEIDLISNVTGERLSSGAMDPAYWREQARSPVQFERSIQALARLGCDAFVEIGPHPTLLGMARHCLEGDAHLWLPSLRRGTDEWTQILGSLAALYMGGTPVDWSGFDAGYARRKVVLPTYPFQRERFWVDVAPEVKRPEKEQTIPVRVSEMLHDIVWREGPPAGRPMAAAGVVRSIVSPRIAEIARESGLEAFEPFGPALDRLATSYIVRALRGLGADLRVGTEFLASELADRLGVLARHRRLFERLAQILGEDGLLAPHGAGWRVVGESGDRDPDAEYEQLRQRHPVGAAELLITSRCARELGPVLRGEIDPLTLLFPGGSLADMERLYRTSAPAKTYNRLIAEAVATLHQSWSADRPMRVLEIGGGTGSTTSYTLPVLPEADVEYTFTDVSPLFLNRAREAFSDRRGMRFAVLDIASDPLKQGFAGSDFDVVIGANVVHATQDVATSLAHTRTLLAPGGTLVLLEATTPQRFGDLTVGLLEGWWGFTDLERRHYALMPRDQWMSTLREAGFESLSVIVDENDGPVLKQQAILIAQTPSRVIPRTPARWLIVPDAAGVADTLAAALRAAGDDPHVLQAGTGAIGRAIDEATRRGTPIAGVVHLPALDIAIDDATAASTLWADQERLVRGALDTVQTLAAAQWSEQPPTLWFITRGAQSTRLQEGSNPAQATVWGLSHVVAMEHPELRCRRVDLDAATSVDDSLPDLVTELHASSREDQVALRGERRLLRRLVRRDAGTLPTIPGRLSPEHTYLVTGGLRGLGLRVAEWLVEQGARSLVLMGRRAPDPTAEAVIRRLEAHGVRVRALTGDVAREADVRSVLDEVAKSMPALRGIVHAAGVLDDGVLAAQSWARFATVMAPKVLGTWHLHRLTGPLDFFVLFSSGAAIAGSPGQANHAAANAFEDAFAWYRQAHGQATVSINWGPWAEVGAAADRSVSGPSFLRQIAPRDGLSALEVALRSHDGGSGPSRPQVAVLATDWSKVGGSDSLLTSPLFREVAAATRTAARSSASPTAATEATLRERLRATTPNRRRAVLQDHVRTLTVRVLGVQPSETFDVREPLRQLGLDSLMAVELRNLLAKEAERPMPATITFDYPSVSALTDYLAADAFADVLSVSGAASNPERAADMSSNHVKVDDVLSCDELAARLAEKLDRMMLKENL